MCVHSEVPAIQRYKYSNIKKGTEKKYSLNMSAFRGKAIMEVLYYIHFQHEKTIWSFLIRVNPKPTHEIQTPTRIRNNEIKTRLAIKQVKVNPTQTVTKI